MFDAENLVALAGPVLSLVEALGQLLVENLVDEGALAAARHSCHAHQDAEGELDVYVLQVVLAGTLDDEGTAIAGASGGGHGDLPETTKILASKGCLRGDYLVQRAFSDDPAAVLSGAGAEVDYMVGGAHYGLVVLDDQDGVAHVPETLQGADEPVVVGGVEADRGLVADVEDTHEAAAYLGRESNPLSLAAAEGAGGAVQGDVVEAYVPEED